MKLIGIHGKKRAGKDTAGKIIQEQLGFKIDSFADPLRKFGLMTFGINEENREQLIESIGVSGRQVLQLVGTEVGRNINQNFWIEALRFRNPSLENIIITDVRFNNEAEFITSNGGKILKIVRPSLESSDNHASEIPIDDKYVDSTIINDSSIDSYRRSINEWLNSHTK